MGVQEKWQQVGRKGVVKNCASANIYHSYELARGATTFFLGLPHPPLFFFFCPLSEKGKPPSWVPVNPRTTCHSRTILGSRKEPQLLFAVAPNTVLPLVILNLAREMR